MKGKKKANYGQEMAIFLAVLAVLSIGLPFIGTWVTISVKLSVICYSVSLMFAILVLIGIWSSRIGKLKMRDQVFSKLHLNGDELILDVGCGRGLLLIKAAKMLPDGKAVGADHWRGTMEYSYSEQMALKNAEIEGIRDRIEIKNADARSLPFDNDSFDVVMTSLMMHHVADAPQALKEMVRVLKPGGRLIVADLAVSRFENELKKASFTDIQIERSVRLFFLPVGIIRGKKQ